LKVRANIRLRSDGRYEARYLKGKDADGRVYHGSTYGATSEEAEENRKKQLEKLHEGKSVTETVNIKATRVKKTKPLDEETAKAVEQVLENTPMRLASCFPYVSASRLVSCAP